MIDNQKYPDDNQPYPNPANWQIADGMTVYSTEGDTIGTVRNYDPQAGYLDVQKGWLFKKDFYVPLKDVDTVLEEGIMLKPTKDQLNDDRYSMPPAPTAGAVYTETVVTDEAILMGPGPARKHPFDGSDRYSRSAIDDPAADTPELADQARADQRFRAR